MTHASRYVPVNDPVNHFGKKVENVGHHFEAKCQCQEVIELVGPDKARKRPVSLAKRDVMESILEVQFGQ